MKTEEIKDLFQKFESIACDYEGVECWSARELCGLLGYAKWQKFENVLAVADALSASARVSILTECMSPPRGVIKKVGLELRV